METIQELLSECTAMLEQKTLAKAAASKPYHPMAVLYGGSQAHQARPAIHSVFRRIWRRRGDSICHYVVNGSEIAASAVTENGEVTEEQTDQKTFMEQIQKMHGETDTFEDMGSSILCCVMDSRDYDDLDGVRQAFETASKWKETLKRDYLMCVFFLNEGIVQPGVDPSLVRAWLTEQEKEKRLPLLLLSTKLHNGALLTEGRETENYTLAANVMVIANSNDGSSHARIASMFPPNGTRYMTAAYSRLERPNQRISETVLNSVLNWTIEQMQSGNTLTAQQLNERMGLGSGGKFGFLDKFYQEEVRKKGPEGNILDCFPRKRNMRPIANNPLREFNEETCNAMEAFFRINDMTFEDEESDILKEFRSGFRSLLRERLNIWEIYQALTPRNIRQFAAAITVEAPDEREEASHYFMKRIRQSFYQKAVEICKEEMEKQRNEAEQQFDNLQELVKDFRNIFVSNDDALAGYYKKIADNQLKSNPGGELLEELSQATDGKGMLTALKNCVRGIYNSTPVFSMSYEDELASRLQNAGQDVNQVIQQDLTGSLKVHLQAVFAPELLSTTLMLNAQKANEPGKANEPESLSNYLNNYFEKQNPVFIDTGSSDSVELIVLYNIDKVTL